MSRGPLILSIVGRSDSGKTTLILKLLPHLKAKGYKVAVAKHCPCGFDLDVEGKDSWRFTKAGGEGTFLTSKESIALIRPRKDTPDIEKRIMDYFSDFDIVLMEGYNNETGTKKIEIIRKGIGRMDSAVDNVIAYVSDMKVDAERPVYEPHDASGIISFIEGLIKQEARR